MRYFAWRGICEHFLMWPIISSNSFLPKVVSNRTSAHQALFCAWPIEIMERNWPGCKVESDAKQHLNKKNSAAIFFNAFKDQPRCTTTGTSKATIPSVQWMDEICRESMWSRYMKLKREAFGKKCEKLGRFDHGVLRAWEFPPGLLGNLDFLP